MANKESPNRPDDAVPAGNAAFQTTHWSLVLAAGQVSSAESHQALSQLCENYWWPLYAYVRRRTADPHKAQDLAQAFFAKLLEKNYVQTADPQKGRFRAFLLTALKRFMANEWDKEQAQKRGGGHTVLSLDFNEGERRIALEPADNLTPERLFDRNWVTTLLDRVVGQLRDEYRDAGKGDQFQQLKEFLAPHGRDASYADVAEKLGITAGAARVAAHRMRSRYRELFRQEIAQTVADPADVEDEIRSLFDAFG